MKMKRILLLTALVSGFFASAQITVTRHNGTPVANGQIVAFNEVGFPQGEFDFYVKNNASTSINVRINCTSILNSDGSGFELCFANECLSSVEEGTNYPINQPYLTLAAGGQSGNDGHFLNTVVGTAPYPKDYSFRIFQVGNPSNYVDVTYRFDPNLSVDEINQLETSGVILKSTLVNNELVFDVLKKTNMTVFDINGKQVMESVLEYGMQTFDVSALNSGVYMVYFTNESGAATVKKFIKN